MLDTHACIAIIRRRSERERYGRVRAGLKQKGRPLIAARALALSAALVTDNLRELRRMPELSVENWMV